MTEPAGKINKPAIMLVLVIVGMIALTIWQKTRPPEFKRFRPEGVNASEQFTVELPAPPEKRSSAVPSYLGTFHLTEYRVQLDEAGVILIVGVGEVPAEGKKLPKDELLDTLAHWFTDLAQPPRTSEKPEALGDLAPVPGRRYIFSATLGEGTWMGEGRLMLKGNRFFLVEAMVRGGKEPQSRLEARRLFDSFQLPEGEAAPAAPEKES